MGQIYRSISVTGTRLLEAERTGRVSRDVKGKGQDKQSASQGRPRTSAKNNPGLPTPPPESDKRGAAAAKGASSDPQGIAIEQDMLEVQQRRIEQLEAQNNQLEQQLAALGSELKEGKEKLRALTARKHDQGYKEGYEEARQSVLKDQEKRTAEYRQVRKLFSDSLGSQLEHVNRYAVEIAFSALVRIVGEQYAANNFTRAVVKEALSAVRGASKIAVHISQQDYDIVRGIEAELVDVGHVTDIEFKADPRVSVGGCLIESDTGIWDARLETQLQRLKDSIEQSKRKSD